MISTKPTKEKACRVCIWIGLAANIAFLVLFAYCVIVELVKEMA